MPIKYRPNHKKILEALVLVASQSPGCGFHHILKVLFYADKFHLQRYGRPVLGDSYVKMTAGPVGSAAYDFLKQSDFLPASFIKAADDALAVDRTGNIPCVSSRRAPDATLFSESDMECLSQAIAHCQDMSFDDLCRTTHQERAWVEAQINQEMDYALFLDEDVEHREELLAYIQETSHTIAL